MDAELKRYAKLGLIFGVMWSVISTIAFTAGWYITFGTFISVFAGTMIPNWAGAILEYAILYVVGFWIADKLNLLRGDETRRIITTHMFGFGLAYLLILPFVFKMLDFQTALIGVIISLVGNILAYRFLLRKYVSL